MSAMETRRAELMGQLYVIAERRRQSDTQPGLAFPDDGRQMSLNFDQRKPVASLRKMYEANSGKFPSHLPDSQAVENTG